MKPLFLISFLLLYLGSVSYAQTIVVLQKDEIYKASKQGTIVMDAYTFGKFSYTTAQCDTLKQEIKRLDSLILQADSTQQNLVDGYKALILNKTQQIHTYEQSFLQMKNTLNKSLEQQNQLQLRLNTLEQKHQRTRFWRNVFVGTTAVLGGMLYLSIVH